ncbi:HEAT repeat domain-containing protein [Streptomyces sp. NPDC020875]|uniref:HEAT repeat domain-containing protein n=1 Tax=Streptomyces sp. NPDC020875 TaxID=3154898 RepID=UPI00340BDF1A
MWVGMDAVGWGRLKHNYGSAEDVPGLLRRCAGPEVRDANVAADELLNLLFHQGGWICSAASAALPFVVRLAAEPQVPSRRALLELVSMLAAEAGQIEERFLDQGWAAAWERALPEVSRLLDDPEPEVRRAAADVLGACGSPGELVLPGLLRAWEAEGDPAARLELVLALGQAVRRAPVGVCGDEVSGLLHGLLDAPEPQTRLAAVHALAPGDPGLPARRLGTVLGAVRDPSAELWRHTSSIQTGVRGVQSWTGGLMPGPDPAFVQGLLADHDDDEQRIGALGQAGVLLSRWRSPAPALLPSLVARLADPVPEVRFRAVELLACSGTDAAGYADEVAGLLSDTATRSNRTEETVGDGALWALARMNDPRCLPGVIELINGTRPGFASASVHYPASDLHLAVLPALDEVLGVLRDHAESLLPAIGDRLRTAMDGPSLHRLCGLLADWGPAAEAAVPSLLGLLEDDRTWAPAATALAGIGTAGRDARKRLLLRSRTGDASDRELAAWAYWKVGGEPGPAVELLGRTVTERRYRHPELRRIADLGTYAAPLADRLAALTTDTDPWIRVEAAHALWAATGDTERAVPVLATVVQGLADDICQPVMLPAVRHLTRIGPAARTAAYPLRELADHDRRLRSNGGWRGFLQDESIRTAVGELLRAAERVR